MTWRDDARAARGTHITAAVGAVETAVRALRAAAEDALDAGDELVARGLFRTGARWLRAAWAVQRPADVGGSLISTLLESAMRVDRTTVFADAAQQRTVELIYWTGCLSPRLACTLLLPLGWYWLAEPAEEDASAPPIWAGPFRSSGLAYTAARGAAQAHTGTHLGLIAGDATSADGGRGVWPPRGGARDRGGRKNHVAGARSSSSGGQPW